MLPQPAALTSMAIRRCSLPSMYAVFHSAALGAGTRNLLLYSSGPVTFPAPTGLSCPGTLVTGSGDGKTGSDRRFPVSPTLSRTISESRFFSFLNPYLKNLKLLNYTTGIVSEYKIKEEENRTEPPVTYSHPKSVIVMMHMTGGRTCRCVRAFLPMRRRHQRHAARSGVEKRAGFRFLVHRPF